MSQRILVIDIGNTSISLGLYSAGRMLRTGRLAQKDAQASARSSVISRVAGKQPLDGVALDSVVPSVNPGWQRSLSAQSKAPMLWAHHRLDLGVPVDYPHAATIGADRLANTCGGAQRHGVPLIVADFGTAVTFDVIHPTRGYVGGIIAPGLPLMFDYLAEKTALLPHIAPGRTLHRVGRSTTEAMRLGAQWGYRGMVSEILRELRKAPGMASARCVATGGYAGWVVQGLRPVVKLDQDLTLYGLARLFELNAGEAT